MSVSAMDLNLILELMVQRMQNVGLLQEKEVVMKVDQLI